MVRQVVLEVTSACNLDCAYCYNAWKSPRAGFPKGQLPTAELIRVIDRLATELPLESIAISGGEPFLREDLPEIVARIWAHNIRPVVITNGTLLTKERIERTPGVHNYELPLLSYRREIHDRLTRRAAFDGVIEGALNLRQLGERFAIAFIATRINYKDLARTLELAVALGAEGLLYNRMNVSVNNYPHLRELLPTPQMLMENLEVLDDFAARYPFPISCSIPIQPCLIDLDRYQHVRFGFCPLGGEDSYFTVGPMGNLRVCNHSAVMLGNVLEHTFEELYHHPFVETFKTMMPESCQDCPPEIRDRCHGGCKAAAEVCFGSFSVEEPFLACNLKQRAIPSVATASSG